MADDHKLDSLTFSDRLSLRTNGIDWMMLLPNIGIEFDLDRYNWSRNAVALNIKGNWNTKHTFNPGMVYNLFEVRAEYRNYWRTRKTTNELGPHRHTYEKILSGRRRHPRHPNTTWYRGAYLSYDDYSFLLGKTGKQGKAITLGGSYGIIRPLYIFPSGKSVDLDFGFSAGLCMSKYEKYGYDRETASYPRTEAMTGWKFIGPVLTEARVGLVYRLGTVPVYSKYRWRYDVDMAYHEKVLANLDYKAQLRAADLLYMKVFRYYQNRYDSLLIINMRNHESVLNERLADTRDMKRKADKARADKAREVQEKAREQQRQERMKQAQAQAVQDSIDLVDQANTRKMEEQVKQKLEAEKLKEQQERKIEKAAEAEEKAFLKQQAAEQKAVEKAMSDENKKYEAEKRKQMNEAYAIQKKYDAEQKAKQKEADAKAAAKEKERAAKNKEWQRTLDKMEKEQKKKNAAALKKQNAALNGEDADEDDDEPTAEEKAEAAKAEREAKKKAQEEAKAAAKAAKEAKKKAEAEAKAAAKAAKANESK